MDIQEIVSAKQSPLQNPFVERVIGSIRRECLDHVVALGEGHLRRVLREYVAYYNRSRCHMALDGNAPEPRQVEGPVELVVVAWWPSRKPPRVRKPRPAEWMLDTPDVDNVVKAVADALNKVAYRDDRQVVRLIAEKRRAAQGEAPRVEVAVRPA